MECVLSQRSGHALVGSLSWKCLPRDTFPTRSFQSAFRNGSLKRTVQCLPADSKSAFQCGSPRTTVFRVGSGLRAVGFFPRFIPGNSKAKTRSRSGWRGAELNLDGRLMTLSKRRHKTKCTAKVGAVELLDEPLMKLTKGQHLVFHELPSGLRMEVIIQRAEGVKESKAPILFVHGSYHAAWCWACWWLPYFGARGHDCYAVSLLGQGASDIPEGKVSLSLQSHARDLAHFIRHNLNVPPVLVGHSFGGLIVQWYFSQTAPTESAPPTTLTDGWEEPFPKLAAAVLMCSTPPTGNKPMVKRFLKRDFFASIKITLSLAAKLFGSSLSLCRESFFSPNLPEADVRKYQKLLKESSRHPMLDLQKLDESLPLPQLPPQAPPVFVLAAQNDFLVDQEGAQETAKWYGVEPVVISSSGHDIMLDVNWENGAQAILSWLSQKLVDKFLLLKASLSKVLQSGMIELYK